MAKIKWCIDTKLLYSLDTYMKIFFLCELKQIYKHV